MGTAMIVLNGPLSRPNVRLQNWAWRAPGTESGIQTAEVAKVLIGIGAIFIAITHMMKGLVINF
jgi:hypothetical protein